MTKRIKHGYNYTRGYNFAAGCLLRGYKKELDTRHAIPDRDRDEFDDGVEQAIKNWKEKTDVNQKENQK